MNREGPHHDDPFESDESSGVTTMAPMPAKTLRLSELDESDRTAYFSVTALMERGKAVAARAEPPTADTSSPSAPPPPEAAQVASAPPGVGSPTPKASFLQQLRDASLPRKASLVMLPLLIGLLAANPLFKQARPSGAAAASSADRAPVVSQQVAESELRRQLAPTPAEPPPPLPKGMTLERAASDALAAGDFPRALGFYRALSRAQPNHPAFKEATRILERREREKQR